jgi:hypothetical protein
MDQLEEAANERISYIEKRQQLLASAVSDMQATFFKTILNSIDKITKNPNFLDYLFHKFTRGPYLEVVSQFASDVQGIGRANGAYFKAVSEGLLFKNYRAIKNDIDASLLARFGLDTQLQTIQDGFFDLFIRDTSIQQQVKKTAYQLQRTGKGPEVFAEELRGIIEGDPGQTGAYERHFNRYVYDTYQQADAEVQELYAKKLDLQAAYYSGGIVRDTRPFCKERNGKVWLRSEIAAWNEEEWAGKIKDGPVEINRGGYGCRHHYSWITNKMALRRRQDVIEDKDGNLQTKP